MLADKNDTSNVEKVETVQIAIFENDFDFDFDFGVEIEIGFEIEFEIDT